MKLIYSIVLILAGLSTVSAQQVTKRNMNFIVGDIVCSNNSKLAGGEFFNCNEKSVDKFVGVFSGVEVRANTRRDEVFVSKGIMEVNISEEISKGDYLTTGFNGKAAKAKSDGYIIGVAIEPSANGKVKVALDFKYIILK